ncbi:MAG: ABC transporter permease [Saprospiraceae bacterium]|nr:ABC transporter permease [Saprospiraceae bacterium]
MRFIIIKLGIILISVFSVISLISLIIYLAPIDPARIQFGQRADPKSIEIMRAKLFLDKSYAEQIYRYFEDLSPFQIIHRNNYRLEDYSYLQLGSFSNQMIILKYPYLRRSYISGEKVSDLIVGALFSTLALGFCAMLISIVLGLFLGITAAIHFGTWLDQSITAITTVFYAIPSYISAILFAVIFGYYFGSFTGLPVQGSLNALDDYGNEFYDFRRIILPALALGIRPVAMICQMTRASLLEIYSQDYVRTAVSMGLKEGRVLHKHIFPNALNPIITTISGWFASLLTGAFFVEYVFNYRGLGDLTIQALNQFDLPVVLASCVVTVSLFILVNSLADILYTWIDPRVKI